MSSLGFTGSQDFDRHGDEVPRLDAQLRLLVERYEPDTVVTGACLGYDAAIHLWFEANMPDVKRIVVVPSNQSKVSVPVLYDPKAEFIRMSPGTSYRARNEEIVTRSDTMAAFWTGKRAYSGTYMTMRIADKQGNLHDDDIFGVGILTDEEARFLFRNPITL